MTRIALTLIGLFFFGCTSLTLDLLDPGFERFNPPSMAILPLSVEDNPPSFAPEYEALLDEAFAGDDDYSPLLGIEQVNKLAFPGSATAASLRDYLLAYHDKGVSIKTELHRLCSLLSVKGVLVPRVLLYEVSEQGVGSDVDKKGLFAKTGLRLILIDGRTNRELWLAEQKLSDEIDEDASADERREVLAGLVKKVVRNLKKKGPI